MRKVRSCGGDATLAIEREREAREARVHTAGAHLA